jgi:hypothetical protein
MATDIAVAMSSTLSQIDTVQLSVGIVAALHCRETGGTALVPPFLGT